MPARASLMVRLASLLLASSLCAPTGPLPCVGRAAAQEAAAPAPVPEPTAPPPAAEPAGAGGTTGEAIPAPTTEVPSPPAAAARDAAEGRADSERQAGWVDQGKRFLEVGIFWPIVELDRLFADDRQVTPRSPGSLVRWRQDLVTRGDGTFAYATSLRATLRFPFLSHRWDRLVLDVSGQTEDALGQLVPGDTPIPARRSEVTVGVGLTLLETLWTDTDARVGLLAGLPPGVYGRLRLRHAAWLGEVALARLSLGGFWQTNTGWGTREEVDLDRLLAPWLFSRLAAVGTLTERSRGLEWALEPSLAATAGRSVFALAGGASGATDGGRVVEVWRVLARARRDVWRRWLFLELEPQVTWTRHPGGGREREAVVILRLDIVFEQRPRAAGAAPRRARGRRWPVEASRGTPGAPGRRAPQCVRWARRTFALDGAPRHPPPRHAPVGVAARCRNPRGRPCGAPALCVARPPPGCSGDCAPRASSPPWGYRRRRGTRGHGARLGHREGGGTRMPTPPAALGRESGPTRRVGGRPATGRSGGEVAVLYRRHGPVVYRRCLHLLRNREAAEDVTQEVFLRLLREFPALADRGSLLPWIFRVATNASLNLRRNALCRGEAWASSDLALATTAPPHGGEARVLAAQLLARFDETSRAVALQVFVGGLEHAEAAVLFEISPRGVARKLAHFRDEARRVLEEA